MMRRTSIVSRYFVIVIFLLLLITALLPQTFSISTDDDPVVGENNGTGTGARSIRATFTVEGTSTKTITSDYDKVIVKDNGTLIIGSNIRIQTAKGKGRLIVRDNGTVIMNKEIVLFADMVSAYCKKFEIQQNASIKDAKNVHIHTQDEIILEEVIIECKGERGQAAGPGENSVVELVSDKLVKIIGGSEITAEGGDGDDGNYQIAKSNGGNGGEGRIEVRANDTDKDPGPSVQVLKSSLEATGGNGGYGDKYYDTISDGGDGGTGVINIISFSKDSNDKVDIEKSNLISKGGLLGSSGGQTGAEPGLGGDGPIFIECKKLYVDGFKENDDIYWNEQTTTNQDYNSELGSLCEYPSITITAPNQAYLFFPKIKGGLSNIQDYKIITAKGSGTIVNIMNLLNVNVVDNAGQSLKDAQVDIYDKQTQTIVQNGNTDDDGNIIFLIQAYKIKPTDTKKEPMKYTAKAVFSGITKTYPEDVAPSERYNDIEIEITLVEVVITDLEFGDQKLSPPVDGTKVGGVVTIKGTAKPSGTNLIESVEVEVIAAAGGILPQEAVDISQSQDKTKWSYTFDSIEKFADRTDITIEVTARDSAERSSTASLNLKVRYDVLPSPPSVTIKMPLNNVNITDREGDEKRSEVWINGTALDPDWEVLGREDSREVVEINIVIQNEAGSEVLNETLDKDPGLTKINDGESYTWSYNWVTRKWSSSTYQYVFPNGKYSVHVTAKDDTTGKALISDQAIINIELYHAGIPPSERPVAVITAVTAGMNTEKDGFKYSDTTNTAIFMFKSKKGKNEVSINIDLSGSYDLDARPTDKLQYKVLLDELDAQTWQDSVVIEKEFFGEKAKEYGYYNIQVKVKDVWGWENKFVTVVDEKDGTQKPVGNLTIMIDFIPADKPMGGPFSVIFSLNLSYFEIYIVFFILIIVFNIAAVLMIMSKYKKINKRRTAREVALDAARQKQMDEDKRKREDIYAPLQFVEEGPEAEPGQVSVAGASAVSEIPQVEAAPESIDELLKPAEPEAPQLLSVEQPVYESDKPAVSDKPPEVTPVPTPTAVQAQPVPVQPVRAQPVQTQPQVAQPAQPAQPVMKKPETEDEWADEGERKGEGQG